MMNISDSKRIANRNHTITAGRRHSVGLKSDGTVIAVGDNQNGQCDVSDWSNITSVAAGNVHMATNTGKAHTVGLRSDGTVVAAGWNEQAPSTGLAATSNQACRTAQY